MAIIKKERKMKSFFIYTILIISIFFGSLNCVIAEKRHADPDDDIIKDTKELLDIIVEYKFGDSRAWLNDFEDLFLRIHDKPEIYPEIEKLMIEFLESDAIMLGKQYICKQLGIIGSKQSVTVLSKMLLVESDYNLALLALEPIDDPEVDKALIKETGLPVIVAPNPLLAVCLGTGKALEYLDKFKKRKAL